MAPLVEFPCSLPSDTVPQEVDATTIASLFANQLPKLSESSFVEDAVWKDVYALSGTISTFYSATSILEAWTETSMRADVDSFDLDPRSVRVVRLPGTSWIEARYSFMTNSSPSTSCSAVVSLVSEPGGKWRIWVMRTILEQLRGQSSVDELEPVSDTNKASDHVSVSHFDCVVIGGGQAGLSMGGRLKAMGIDYVVLDKYREVGDSWKERYGSAKLHTTREYAHLPFDRTFPDHYQEWLTKDDLAQGYKEWVKKYNINIWVSSKVKKGTWNSTNTLCTLEIEQPEGTRSITCSYVVLAGGGGGQEPVMPEYLGRDSFKGEVLHSATYKDASNWQGKRGIVVGTANTAHDVAEDMLEAGCVSVTMLQRSRTFVLPQAFYKRTSDPLYNSILPTTVADRAFLTQPYAIADLISQKVLHGMAAREPERYESLERAGFKVDPYGSITHALYHRLGGHYMDVGASAKISQGLIKVKSNALPTQYTPSGLLFSDGTELPADVVVFATGFNGNMRYLVDDIFGSEVAEQMGDFWGLDKHGEIKGAYKPCGHPALWYHGGTIGQARYMARFIAMSIKAKILGTPLVVYEQKP